MGTEASDPAAEALIPQETLSRAELIQRSGLPAEQVDLAIDAGLLKADQSGRFGGDAVTMLQAAGAIIAAGVAVPDLARLAVRHARNVEEIVDAAIDLFVEAQHARRDDTAEAAEAATGEAFTGPAVVALVPQVVALVAEHFQRTLVSRAVARLKENPE